MNRIKSILLIITVLAVSTSATRADELSALVAEVAATMQKQQMTKDAVHSSFLDTNKSHYRPKSKQKEVDPMLLDGIYTSMKREAFRNMRREIFNENDDPFNQMTDGYVPPTLGRADFFRPVPGIITSLYGWRPKFQRMHHGIDLCLQIGDTVRAALSGTVEKISYDHEGYGHYVVITHPDGMETLYGHLQYPLVSQGQFIYAGQPVGIGGNSGNSTGPHLHFEARIGGSAVDPMLLFDFYGMNSVYYAKETIPEVPKGPIYSHQSKSLKKENTYIVRYGDTVESVARQAGISAMRLCQLNMLNEKEQLPVGRMLKLH